MTLVINGELQCLRDPFLDLLIKTIGHLVELGLEYHKASKQLPSIICSRHFERH